MSWGDSQPHYPGPSIRGPERKPHEGWPSDALNDADRVEIASAHAANEPCGYAGCERDACISHRHACGNDCGVPGCDDCDRHFHAPARRQAAEDAREGYGDWLRDEGKDGRVSQ